MKLSALIIAHALVKVNNVASMHLTALISAEEKAKYISCLFVMDYFDNSSKVVNVNVHIQDFNIYYVSLKLNFGFYRTVT